MTDQNYKLVPTDPNAQMINAAAAAAGVTWDVASRAIDAAIAAAPEPVCRFPSDDEIREFLVTECQAGLIADIDDELLPLAREIIAELAVKATEEQNGLDTI